MEKMMNLAALLAITTQMLGIGGAAALMPPNGLQVLTETAVQDVYKRQDGGSADADEG